MENKEWESKRDAMVRDLQSCESVKEILEVQGNIVNATVIDFQSWGEDFYKD